MSIGYELEMQEKGKMFGFEDPFDKHEGEVDENDESKMIQHA
jgi:hypothetical protein